MKTLLISVDVTDCVAAEMLVGAIKSVAKRWARPLASTWLIETVFDAAEVEAHLAPILGLDDAVIVQETAGLPVLVNTMARWSELQLTVPSDGKQVIPWRRGKVAVAA